MCRLLIDTNILMDTLDERRPNSSEARSLIDRCSGWGEMGMMCSLSIKDVYYIATRLHGEEWARTAIRNLMGLLVIAPVSAEECDMALNSNEPDFEDGIIRACAELNDADYIITRDKDAYKKCKIRSVTAAEYLDMAS